MQNNCVEKCKVCGLQALKYITLHGGHCLPIGWGREVSGLMDVKRPRHEDSVKQSWMFPGALKSWSIIFLVDEKRIRLIAK